nr:hypothetical protein [uncultured Desulfobulbus sp.]
MKPHQIMALDWRKRYQFRSQLKPYLGRGKNGGYFSGYLLSLQ